MSGLLDRIQSLNEQFREALRDARNADEVNQVHWYFTGYGGQLTKLMSEIAEGDSASESAARGRCRPRLSELAAGSQPTLRRGWSA